MNRRAGLEQVGQPGQAQQAPADGADSLEHVAIGETDPPFPLGPAGPADRDQVRKRQRAERRVDAQQDHGPQIERARIEQAQQIAPIRRCQRLAHARQAADLLEIQRHRDRNHRQRDDHQALDHVGANRRNDPAPVAVDQEYGGGHQENPEEPHLAFPWGQRTGGSLLAGGPGYGPCGVAIPKLRLRRPPADVRRLHRRFAHQSLRRPRSGQQDAGQADDHSRGGDENVQGAGGFAEPLLEEVGQSQTSHPSNDGRDQPVERRSEQPHPGDPDARGAAGDRLAHDAGNVARVGAGAEGVHHHHPDAEPPMAQQIPFLVPDVPPAPPAHQQHAGEVHHQDHPHGYVQSEKRHHSSSQCPASCRHLHQAAILSCSEQPRQPQTWR